MARTSSRPVERKILDENCQISHTSELKEEDWKWLKEKPEWFENWLTMMRNQIVIEHASWRDALIVIELCRKNFNDIWYLRTDKEYSDSTLTIYALDKDELLKLKLTLEKK